MLATLAGAVALLHPGAADRQGRGLERRGLLGELRKRRLPTFFEVAERLITGPSIEKSIAPLRSFVVSRVMVAFFLASATRRTSCAHRRTRELNIAPPRHLPLYHAMLAHYQRGDDSGLVTRPKALARVWKAQRFSWMTSILHTFPGTSDYDKKLQQVELDYLFSSTASRSTRWRRTTWVCRS